MNKADFWYIINSAKEANPHNVNKQRDYIEKTLSKYSIKSIREFNCITENLIKEAKEEGLREFLCLVFKDEISNNRFDFFMGWLILQGTVLYDQAIKDPNFLKEVIEINFNNDFTILSFEEGLHIASSAYEMKTGRNYFEDF